MLKWFKKTHSPPTPKDATPTPHQQDVTSYHADDMYAVYQRDADTHEAYRRAHQANRPKTIWELHKGQYQGFKAYTGLFPFLSAATLIAFALFISGLPELIDQPFSLATWLGPVAGCIGAVILIGVIERTKAGLLPEVMRARVLARRLPGGLSTIAFCCILLSIAGSGAGAFYLSQAITDKTGDIESQFNANTAQTATSQMQRRNSLSASYQEQINTLQLELEGFDNQGGKKRCKHCVKTGQGYQIAWDLRHRPGQINAKIDALRDQKRTALAEFDSKAGIETDELVNQRDSQLIANEQESNSSAWFAFMMLVCLEVFNLFAHHRLAVIYAELEREGASLGVIDQGRDSLILTSIRNQARYAVRRMELMSQQAGLIGGATGSHQQEKDQHQIGFTYPKREVTDTLNQPDFDQLKTDILGEMKGLLDTYQSPKNDKADGRRPSNIPPVEHQFSSTNQPQSRAPKKHGQRIEGRESRQAILTAYNTLVAEGKKPTHQKISDITHISRVTVGAHIRQMKKEGILK